MGAPGLGPDEVHLWSLPLDVPSPELRRLRETLSGDEVSRAGRYRFPGHRQRFIARRGYLRAILASYLDTPPERVRLAYGEHSKPVLDGANGLRFNLSSSRSTVVYAIGCEREVGIDLEYLDGEAPWEEIARTFFCPSEVEAIWSHPPRLRLRAFFACWTRKEAYLKARGLGISAPLNGFQVTAAPGEAPALLRASARHGDIERWSLRAPDVASGYAAALCVEGHDWELRTISATEPADGFLGRGTAC